MAEQYKDQEPLGLAQQAERDLNSHQAKQGYSTTDSGTFLSNQVYTHRPSANTPLPSAAESGVDTSVTDRFPGSTVKVGSAASGAGDNREIPVDEGGDLISKPGEKGGSGHPTKARDFEGAGGPETKQAMYEDTNPGNDDVDSNVRQKKAPSGDTVPTDFGGQLGEARNRET